MVNKALIFGLLLYIVTILFSIYQLPGTTELSVVALPMVSILLFRHFRVEFKGEKNIVFKYFSFILCVFISLILLFPIYSLFNNDYWQVEWSLMIGWILLIFLNIIYYSINFLRSKYKDYRTGYLILTLASIVYLIGTIISYSLDSEFREFKYVTSAALILLSVYLYFQFIYRKTLPKLQVGLTLFIGAIFIYIINLGYLFLI